MNRLQGKVAIVTGGALGIGRATALAFGREGAKVAVADINDEAGDFTARQIVAEDGEAFYRHTDVGSSPDVEHLVAMTVERYGKLDIIVNNAGVAIGGACADMTEEDWNRVININLTGIWRGMKYAIPHMIRNGGGAIVNMSSVQGLVGFEGWSGYAATKGATNALTRQAAIDYARHNIRVNAVAPGTIMTPMNTRIFKEHPNPQELIDSWNAAHPIGRFGQPEEVAAAIVFLASDEASFITGEVVRVDGGMVVKGG